MKTDNTENGVRVSSDHDVMMKVREGEIDKLGILFERYKKKLYNFFRISTGDSIASEDLVQNVFMRILKYRRSYADHGDFAVWLYGIARNVRNDHFAKNHTRQISIDDSYNIESADPTPDLVYERSADIDILRKSLMKLNEDTRELIILSRYNNLRYREIAEIFGLSEGAVKVRMYRALKELAEIFHDIEEGGKHHEMR